MTQIDTNPVARLIRNPQCAHNIFVVIANYSFRIAIFILLFLMASQVFAYPSGITGHSNRQGVTCSKSGCHANVNTGYSTSATIYRSDSSPYVNQNVNLRLKMWNSGYTSGPLAGGFNLSVNGGNLYRNLSGTQEPVTNEVTHTSPKNTSGSYNTSSYREVEWGTTSSSQIYWRGAAKGSYTLYLCVNGVNHYSGTLPKDNTNDEVGCTTTTVTVYNQPTLTGWSGTDYFTEGTSSVIDSSVSLTDDTSLSLNRAEISIYSGYVFGQDQLLCPSTSLSCAASGSSLTLTGTASTFTYDAAIQAIRYNNTSQNPSTGTRYVRIRIRDTAYNYGAYDYKNISVTAVNDAPSLNGTIGQFNSYTEGGSATVVDTTVTVSDVDSSSMNYAQVQISSNFSSGDRLTCTSCGTYGLSPSYSNGLLTISGTTSRANYELALESVRFDSTSQNPSTATRTIRFRVRDTGFLYSLWDSTSFNVIAVNDPPYISSFSGTTAHTENIPVVVDGSFTVTDPENNTISSATLTITNYVNGQDVLACTNGSGITCSWNSGSGVLTLSGTTSLANYDAKIQTVTYNNTSNTPTTTTRSIQLNMTDTGGTANGGDNTATPRTKSVSITAVNDLPTSSNDSITATEDTDYVFSSGDFVFNDVDGHTFTSLRIETLPANGDLSVSGAPITAPALPYTIAVASLGQLTYRADNNTNGAALALFQFEVVDSGSNNNISVGNYVMTVNVNAVNDAPTAAGNTVTTNEDTAYPFTSGVFGFSDVDGHAFSQLIIETLPASGDLYDNGGIINSLPYNLTLAEIATLTFLPDPEANGTSYTTFQFEVRDNSGITDTSSGDYIITVDVNAVNDSPSSSSNSFVVNEDTDYVFSSVNFPFSDVADGHTLTGLRIESLPAAGTLQYNSAAIVPPQNYTIANIDGGLLTFRAANNANGTNYTNFQFEVIDSGSDNNVSTGNYLMTANVTAQNDSPTVDANTGITVTELGSGVITSGDLLSSDVEDGASNITYTVTSAPSNGNLRNGVSVLSVSSTFTQANINANQINYIQTNNTGSPTSDGFTFNVDDTSNAGPVGQAFNISITLNSAPSITAGGVLNYTENDPVSVVDGTITISDADADDIQGATVVISNNYAAEDNLIFVNQNGISGIYSAGTLTLSGTTTIANYETALESVQYSNSSEDPSTLARTVTFTVTDDFGNTGAGDNATVNVAAGNDAPTGASNTLNTNEDTPLSIVAADFGFSDIDATDSLTAVTVVTTVGAGTFEVSGGSVTNGTSIVLADLAGNTVFTPAAEANGTAYTSFTFRVNDGTALSVATYTMTVDVTAQNDAPTLDTNTTANVEELGVVTITNTQLASSDLESAAGSITYTVSTAPSNGTLRRGATVLGIGGTFTQADINGNQLNYTHTAAGFNTDSFVFQVKDSDNAGPTGQTFNISITLNQAPTITAGGVLNYTENDIATVIDNTITISDADADDIQGATVVINNNYAAEDNLTFVNQNGISGSYLSGTLTLSGTTTIANYETALESITYNNTSEDPSTLARTVTFTVTDDFGNTSSGSTATINVTAGNDIPSLDINAGITLIASINQVITAAELSTTDIEDGPSNITYTITTAPTAGTLFNNVTALGATDTFTQQDIINGTINYTSGATPGPDGFVFDIDDSGNAGPTSQTFAITISANAPPTITVGGTLNYTENDAATVIDSTVSIVDGDDTNMQGATVSITGNFASSEDTLGFVNQNGISGNYVGGTGVLTLSGSTIIADYQTALSSVTYINSSDDPSTLARTITYAVTDSFGNTSSGSNATVNVAAANDAPTGANNTLNTNEDIPLSIVAADFGFNDVDAADSLSSVTIITAVTAGAMEVNGSPITTGTVSVANLAGNTVFTPVSNASGSPYATFTFRVNDGTALSVATYTMTINVTAQNDAPSLDTNSSLSVAELQPAVITSSHLSSSDVEDVATGITYTVTSGPTHGTLTSNSFTQAQINAGSISYTNTNPGQTSDSFTFDVDDTSNAGPTGQLFSISISPNSAPVITAGGTLSYTENDAATVIDSTVSIVDGDDTDMQGATVSITGNFETSEDVLGFVNQNGISGSYNGATGVLTLSSLDVAITDYETALSSVTYTNSSDDPSTLARTVTYAVTDAFGNTSSGSNATVNVAAANDAPTAANNTVTTLEDTARAMLVADFGFADTDSADSLASVRISTLPSGGLTVSAAAVSLNQVIAVADLAGNLVYTPVNNINGAGVDSFVFEVNDGSEFSASSYTMTIDVTADNDVPSLDTNSSLSVAESDFAVITSSHLSSSDVEDTAAAITYTITSATTNGSIRNITTVLNVSDTFTQADVDAGNINYLNTVAAQVSDSFIFNVDDTNNDGPTGQLFSISISPNSAPVVTAGGTLNYTENDAATVIDSTVAISDADGDNMSSATIVISNNFASGEDVLGCPNPAVTGISCNNSVAGTISLSGSTTMALYETALSRITYVNSSDDPNTLARTITYTVTDDFGNPSLGSTATVNVAAANDAPTAANNTLGTTEDIPLNLLVAAFNFSDIDSADSLSSVRIVTLPAAGVLTVSGGNVTAGDSIVVADLSGNLVFTPAVNASGSPYTSFAFRVDDAVDLSVLTYTMTVNVSADNDAPTLDANNPLMMAELQTSTITSLLLSASDVEDGAAAVTYTVTSVPGFGTLRNGVSVLGMSGSFTQSDIDTNNITYEHTAAGQLNDNFGFDIDDSAGAGPTAQIFSITINPNSAPTITAGATLSYTENDIASVIDNTITINDVDVDGDTMDSAVAQITSGFQVTEDALGCPVPAIAGIACDNSVAGTITLTGNATTTDYETALERVTYVNSSEDPATIPRTVSYSVTDSFSNSSSSATAIVNVAKANDVPTSSNNTVSTLEDTPRNLIVADFNLTDVDAADSLASVRITSLPLSGTLTVSGLAVTINQVVDAADLLGNFVYSPAANANGLAIANFGFDVNDGTVFSAVSYVMTIDVTADNDAPVVDTNSTLLVPETMGMAVISSSHLSSSDVEDVDATLTYTISSVPADGNVRNNTTVLNISDTFTQADIDVGNINYLNTANVTIDSFTFQMMDSGNAGPTGLTFNITISPNTAPVVSSSGILGYTEGDPASIIDSAIVITDAEEDNLQSATVTISAAFVSGEDVLGFVNQSGITGSYDSGTGILTLTGAANLLTYESALSGVTYFNTSSDPSTISRTVAFSVTDAVGAVSVNDTATINITALTDNDNDGMEDGWELLHGLDPTDPTDADIDSDGDGLTNLEEYLLEQSTGIPQDPNVDDVGPALTIPADIVIDATGYLTEVDFGEATAIDNADGATSVNHTITDSSSNVVTQPLPSGSFVITWTSSDSEGFVTSATQQVEVRPLANLIVDQQVGEGQSATVELMLLGDAPTYPVTFNYTLGGTATAADYSNFGTVTSANGTVTGGVITIDSGTSLSFTIDIDADAIADDGETITVTLDTPVNAALGVNSAHTITIVEGNVAPSVALATTLNAQIVTAAYQGAGLSTVVTAQVSDPNGGSFSYDWSATSPDVLASLTAGGGSTDNSISIDADILSAGQSYLIDLIVTDDGMASTHTTLQVQVVAAEPVLSDANDSDGDGIDDLTEGYGDADGDGVPDYLDGNNIGSLLINQTADASQGIYLMTDPGFIIKAGPNAMAANKPGAVITQEDIESYGGMNGGAGLFTDDTSYTNIGGYFNFEVELSGGAGTAHVVIPLLSSTRPGSVYRKYFPDIGWQDYVIDSNNSIQTAPGTPQACPEPGSALYTDGITPFSYCLQLTIEDGGPNDIDGEQNGRIIDPGGMSTLAPEEAAPPAVGNGAMSLWTLYLMLFGVYLRHVRCRFDVVFVRK